MSQENVEVVRRWLTAMNGGPQAAGESLPEFCEADVDYYPVRKFPEARPCHGLEELSEFVNRYLDALLAEWAIEDMIEVGDDRVFVHETMRTEGRGSGVKLEGDLYQCFWLRHGRIFRIEDHLTLSGALRALGLEGETLKPAGLGDTQLPASRENLEIVRAMLEATGPDTNRENWLDEFFDSEIEWHDVPIYPSAGVYVGREALSRHAAEFEEAWTDWSIDIEDIRAAGERVVARIRYRGVGRQSGAPIVGDVENPATGAIFELRRGRILRVLQFVTHAEALEAVGLTE